MKIDLLKGRIGIHRFHMMLVHFPSALYPFSLVMDLLAKYTGNEGFSAAGLYSLEGGLAMSVIAVIYGLIDYLKIDTQSKAWRTAGIHALLNVTWFCIFCGLLFHRVKHQDTPLGWTYLILMALPTAGLFVSNYLGGELVVRHGIGVDKQ